MVNEKLLKAKIIEIGIERKKLAELLGISPTSLNYKLNNKKQFKANEIFALSKILSIEAHKDEYFFVNNVG